MTELTVRDTPRLARRAAADRTEHRRFRPDIQGLRAIAVTLIVLYHIEFPGFSGGYVGVDVFYVISGFLITGLLLDELGRRGRVSLSGFYGRRIRRILPAATVVLVATLIGSWIWFSPLRAASVAGDGKAAAFFVVNERFVSERIDYLAAEVAPSPLQHYWSLAVEEQFYILWPTLLLGLAFVGRRWLRTSQRGIALGVAGVFAASLVASAVLTQTDQSRAFFTLPTRAWELATGAALAFLAGAIARAPSRAVAPAAGCGLLLILVSAHWFDESTAFPGVAALVPVLGSALIIAAGIVAARPTAVQAALGWRPLQVVGLLSFSWYLWHWPVLLLGEAAAGRPFDRLERILAVVFALGLAGATYLLVEQPPRTSRTLLRRSGLTFAIGAAMVLAAFGTAVAVDDSVRAQFADQPAAEAAPTVTEDNPNQSPSVLLDAVAAANATEQVPRNLKPALVNSIEDWPVVFTNGCLVDFDVVESGRCTFGAPDGDRSVVIFGDSHAAQWFDPIERIARQRGLRLIVLTKSSCPAADVSVWLDVEDRRYDECDEWRSAAFTRIAQERPALVVVSTRRDYPRADGSGRPVAPNEWSAGYERTLSEIGSVADDVVLLGDTPNTDYLVAECLAEQLDNATRCAPRSGRALDPGASAGERTLAERASVRFVDPTPWICPRDPCAVIVGDLLVYRDDDHITTTYARWLTPLVEEALFISRDST